MINVTFIGNIFHSDGVTPAQNVRYQGFFIKENPNSSDTIWDTARLSETNQYNFNLGDNTWLSQQGGYAQPFDKVLLCFWLDNTSVRTDLDLTEWAFIEWVLDDRDVYVQDIQLQGASNPTCSFALSGTNPVYLHDTGTNDDSQWIFKGKEHYQTHLWDGYEVFPINKLPDVLIQWGDALFNTYPLSASPFDHTYTTYPADYIITAFIDTESGLSCQWTDNHRVLNVVYNGLTWTEPVVLGQSKTYTPDITGDLVSISGVDYYIDGAIKFTDLAYNETFDYTFVDPGNHIIRQCIKYDDGFNPQIQCEDFTVKLITIADFVDSEYECGLVFTDTSIVGNPPIVKYQWDVTDGMFLLAHVEGAAYHDWYYAWPYKGTFRVRLAVTDSNGYTSSITKEYVVTECPNTTVEEGGGGGGGGSPWVYAPTQYVTKNEPLPTVHIIKIDDCDEKPKNKRILILEIKDDDSEI